MSNEAKHAPIKIGGNPAPAPESEKSKAARQRMAKPEKALPPWIPLAFVVAVVLALVGIGVHLFGGSIADAWADDDHPIYGVHLSQGRQLEFLVKLRAGAFVAAAVVGGIGIWGWCQHNDRV